MSEKEITMANKELTIADIKLMKNIVSEGVDEFIDDTIEQIQANVYGELHVEISKKTVIDLVIEQLNKRKS